MPSVALPIGRVARALALALLLAVGHAHAQSTDLPVLTQPVHDLAGVVDSANAARLDELIRAVQAATGDVVAVLTIRTFQPRYADIREYAVKAFENHGRGIGQKGKDNGVLVVLAVDDRRVHIEVGYGLEGAITDGFAGETARLYMRPAFQQGRYGDGLLAGVTRLVSRIAEERNVDIANLPRPARARPGSSDLPIPLPFIIFLILLFFLITRGGGGYGGGGRGRRYHHGSGPWSGWGGGGSFGGGSFGGGSFGGGFGGFGGGRSGGGGGGAGW